MMRAALKQAEDGKTSAFIPFIMAGDPDLDATPGILRALQEAGAGVIELGIPFSDPVADGETVQRAAERALASGTTLRGVLDMLKKARAEGLSVPVCLFSYLNPIVRMGFDVFAKEAKAAGANGALVVDLPPEEAGEYCAAMKKHALETVFLCSPTTTPERLKAVDACSTGFVYYVSREGVTGTQAALPQQLENRLKELRAALSSPVAVGFGISTPAHVCSLNGKAAGIVVGSALVKVIGDHPSRAAGAAGDFVRTLRS